MKFVVSTSTISVGCTFIDWSLHWLAGKTQNFLIERNKWYDLTPNPLTNSVNAHSHEKNHPAGLEGTRSQLENFDSSMFVSDDILSMYPTPSRYADSLPLLGISARDLHNPQTRAQFVDHYKRNYVQMLEYLYSKNAHVILVAVDPIAVGVQWSNRGQTSLLAPAETKFSITQLDVAKEVLDIYCPNWLNGIDSNEIWDVREQIALNLRPFGTELILPGLTLPFPYLWINCLDFWFDPASTMQKIFQFVELEIDSQRYTQWLPVMQEWKKIHHNEMAFWWALPQIVRSIINGHWYVLPELTLFQEAVIQHCLIYQHNKNLKTWQLVKFPSNTRDLTVLLEPNHHCLSID
jgi:hypothetical protein